MDNEEIFVNPAVQQLNTSFSSSARVDGLCVFFSVFTEGIIIPT